MSTGNQLGSNDVGGTGQSLGAPAPLPQLPIPSVALVDPRSKSGSALNPLGLDTSQPIGAGSPGAFAMARMPLFSAAGIDKRLLDPELDLRLELGWYRKASGKGKTGWHHPNHDDTLTVSYNEPVAPVLPNTPLRGGLGFHCTEWSITSVNQSFIIGSLAQFFRPIDVPYVDVNGNENVVLSAYIPTYANRIKNNGGHKKGRTFAYDTSFRPNYFAFRFSTKDKTATNGRRNEGPWSKTIAMSNAVFPFQTDDTASKANGRTCAAIAPGYVAEDFQCWFGTRLPT